MKNGPLVKLLAEKGYLTSPLVRAAFGAIDRKDFVEADGKDEAYGNHPLPIGFGQTISQPLTVAFMLELLEARAGEKVLEIGAGSGWQSALLGHIVKGPAREGMQEGNELRGRVIAIERVEELADRATKNIEQYHLISDGTVRVVRGDGAEGRKEDAPYDRIIAAASADAIPAAWKEEVRIGGRIVAPVGESIIVLDKTGPHTFKKRQYFGFHFVPLVRGKGVDRNEGPAL